MEYDKRIDALLTGYGYTGDYKMKPFSWLDDLGYKGDLLDKVRVWHRNGSPFTAVDGSIGQVTDGEEVEIDEGLVVLEVQGGQVVGASLELEEDLGIVEDGEVFEVTGGTVTISVDNGVVSADFVADEE